MYILNHLPVYCREFRISFGTTNQSAKPTDLKKGIFRLLLTFSFQYFDYTHIDGAGLPFCWKRRSEMCLKIDWSVKTQ